MNWTPAHSVRNLLETLEGAAVRPTSPHAGRRLREALALLYAAADALDDAVELERGERQGGAGSAPIALRSRG